MGRYWRCYSCRMKFRDPADMTETAEEVLEAVADLETAALREEIERLREAHQKYKDDYIDEMARLRADLVRAEAVIEAARPYADYVEGLRGGPSLKRALAAYDKEHGDA